MSFSLTVPSDLHLFLTSIAGVVPTGHSSSHASQSCIERHSSFNYVKTVAECLDKGGPHLISLSAVSHRCSYCRCLHSRLVLSIMANLERIATRAMNMPSKQRLCLLNIVSTYFLFPSETAHEMVRINASTEQSSINCCLALIMMAYREIGTGGSISWMYVGKAIRMV